MAKIIYKQEELILHALGVTPELDCVSAHFRPRTRDAAGHDEG